jgi:protein-S-isoprenylcysteine O-methyltransferase Ste14
MSDGKRVSKPGVMKTPREDGMTSGFVNKLIFSVFYNVLFFGGMLFLPAGTFDWPRAWAFLGVLIVATLATMIIVFPGREDLLNERFKPPVQKGQPLADKIIVLLLIASFIGVIVFIPLDVFRFHLMGKPDLLVSSSGLILFIAGWLLISLTFKENAYAAPVVRHQEERHQTVVDTGVYSVVRHPMYAGAALLMVGLPLWLESYAAAALAIVPIALTVVRIRFEERFLKRELRGYEDYTKRVKYRLIPFIW